MKDRLEIKVILDDGTEESREIFFSYGLLNQLCSVVGTMERIVLIDTDAELADTVIDIVLIPRHPSGRPTIDLKAYQPPGLTQETAEAIFDAVKEQTLGFFSRRVASTVKLMTDNQAALTAIDSSLIGLSPKVSNKS